MFGEELLPFVTPIVRQRLQVPHPVLQMPAHRPGLGHDLMPASAAACPVLAWRRQSPAACQQPDDWRHHGRILAAAYAAPNESGSTAKQDEDWRARESAILALGAISEGCHRGLVPYLGELVGLLMPPLSDARPLVRCCTPTHHYS